MEINKTTYPESLAGRFLIIFSELRLLPIHLINVKPTDHNLREIKVESNGLATVIFENGKEFTIEVRLDRETCTYLFEYGRKRTRKPNHSFQVIADLAGCIQFADITSWIDLSDDAK